jgi:predicted Zn-dependent peptidase
MRAILLASLLLASPLPAAEVREWAVDAGTTGLLVQDDRVPLVHVTIRFAAGSWSPWVDANDADAAFEIQAHDRKGDLRHRADRLAASLDLAVGARSSTLSASCLKEDLPAVLDLVRDVLANRDFDRSELKRRRQSAKIGWKLALKEPRFVLMQAAARLLFREDDPRRDPYEKPRPFTTDAEALAAARDTLVRLPGRMVGFAGALTVEEAKGFAEGLLPPPLSDPTDRVELVLPPLLPGSERPREVDVPLARLTQVYFAYGRESLAWEDEDAPASMIVDHALGGHFHSRLMLALRQEEGDTYGASVYDDGGRDAGLYGLTTFTRTENAGAAETKIREVLETLHRDGITEEERALAAGNVVGRRAFLRQSPQQILSVAMTERAFGLPYGFFDRRAERAAALTLDEVNAFVRRFYDPEGFTMIRVKPAR